MKASFLLRSALTVQALLFALSLQAELPDSVWYDTITGTQMHLQRVERLEPYTCPLHLLGKRADGSPRLPAMQALASDLGVNALVWGWDRFVQDRGWAHVDGRVLHENFTGGWVWDNDSFSGNQFSHPYHGSMFYNAAREHGLSYGVSVLYPVLGSLTWELLCETNRPAVNDLISTGIGGVAIGEVTHRVSDIFFDDTRTGASRVAREVIGSFLNPVRGVHRLLSGEMFRVHPHHAGKKETPEPYSFQLGFGDRYMYDVGAVHPRLGRRYREHVPFLDVRFSYGNHYNNLDQGFARRAYDYFDLYALVNLATGQPTVGELEINGRIGSIQRQLPRRWKIDIGFYQNYKYVDHYSADTLNHSGNLGVISEAASFGAGFHATRQGRAVTLLHDFMFSAVPLGGSTADYYALRRYNFGTGFSLRHKFGFVFDRHLSFGSSTYFMRLFILKGVSPAEIERYRADPVTYHVELSDGVNAWGDKGEQSILQNRIFLNVNVTHNLQLHLQHEFYLRHGKYRAYPSLTAKSHEWKAGFSYAL